MDQNEKARHFCEPVTDTLGHHEHFIKAESTSLLPFHLCLVNRNDEVSCLVLFARIQFCALFNEKSFFFPLKETTLRSTLDRAGDETFLDLFAQENINEQRRERGEHQRRADRSPFGRILS